MEQGLPVNFENTASTWQNMPGMAAFYTGLQNQSAQDNIRMLQEAFAREQAFKEQQRPVELQNLRGLGDLQAAQAMYQRALGRGANVKSELEEQTLSSNVSAIRSKNAAGQVEDQGRTLAAKASMYRNLATLTSDPNIPGWAKVQAVIKNLGIEDPDGNVAQKMLADVKNLPKILAAEADFHYKNSDTTKLEEMKKEADIRKTNITAGASRYSADKGLEGVKYAADARTKAADAKNAAISFEVTISKLTKASEKVVALVDKANEVEATNPELAISLRARANDPTLMAQRDAELAAAGQNTVNPNVAPGVLTSRTSQVNIPPAGGNGAKSSSDPYEGRTATGPDEEKIIRKNGKWIPLQ